MLLLTGTAHQLLMDNSAAGSLQVHASWVDNNAGTITPGSNNLANVTTAVTGTVLVPSPGSGVQRNIKAVFIHNESPTVTNIVDVAAYDGTNRPDLVRVTLLPEETLVLDAEGSWHHHDANGADYGYFIAYVDAALGVSGSLAETIPREICTETNTAAPTASGTLFMMAIFLRRGTIVSNLSFHSATTASATPTNGFFALYDGSRNLLAQSANFTTEAWAANTIKTKAMSAAYTIPTTGLYYVAIMITATTIPTLKGDTARTGGQLASQAPIIAGASTTGLTTSLPNPAAAITANSLLTVWAAVS